MEKFLSQASSITEALSSPIGDLHLDNAYNLYGTTYFGGGSRNLGTVFKLSSTGAYRMLHSFAGGSDGANPSSGLIGDRRGHLYGTTANAGGACSGSCGVVYEITPAGAISILYAFKGDPSHDGDNPSASLISDGNGTLYGTTSRGGGPSEDGTVFKLTGTGFKP